MPFRYYQTDADNAIYAELQERDKCIVKMFCGTGKSLLMRYCKIIQNKKLVVYVFPSLSLIDQFYTQYLSKDHLLDNVLRISSDVDDTPDEIRKNGRTNRSTTKPVEITQFITRPHNLIICVTYNSFKTLLDHLGSHRISVCIFDEAHHAVGETYKQLIFETDICDKQIFFTATPKNANGIVMYDREHPENGMCCKLVYDYSYLRGVNEGYLNPFEIRIDMFTENTNRSVYETIARAVFTSGNSRVLTFHIDVETDRDKSVLNFVNEPEFKRVFKEIQKSEFPQIKKYKKISMIGLTAKNSKKREHILKAFDESLDDEVIVISSCRTIGEGIDTKNANMCVFVDPKASPVQIIQNIGRIVRKQLGIDKPNSTILIPCWVDGTKYLECGGDREKCDEVIRQDMSGDGGNFNGILNVMSALKQEDEDLYDICLHYPDRFSPQEIRSNLEKHGFRIGEVVGDGGVVETLEDLLETEIDYEDYEDCDTTEEMIMNIAEDNDVCVEIHTDYLKNPVERYNSECESGEIVRLYRDSCDSEDNEEEVYMPILAKTGGKRTREKVDGPKRENRMRVNVHTNPDVKVLWNITGGFDLTKDICSCVIDCEVVDNWYENLDATKKFIDENERRPTESSNDKLELTLTWFISNQLQNYKKTKGSMKVPEKYDLWTTFLEEYKEYFKSADAIWYETFVKLKRFIEIHKQRPSPSTNKKLKGWLESQRTHYRKKDSGMKNEQRYNEWTKFLEEYREYMKNVDDIWYDTFEDVKTFISKNEKRPSAKSINDEERRLGSWIIHQTKNFKNKSNSMKDQYKYELWKKFLEEYQEHMKSNDEIWHETFNAVKTYINEHKRKPANGSSDKYERSLANWISDQKKNSSNVKKDEIKCKLWNEFMKDHQEYFKSDDEVWYELFGDVKRFIAENARRPISCSDDANEKQLGSWIIRQNMNFKNKSNSMKDQYKYELWKKFLEEYHYMKSNDDMWHETFNAVNIFIDKNKKRPSSESKNKNEKLLGVWILNQQNAYKHLSGAMNDTERFNLWTNFLIEYQEYMKTDSTIWHESFELLKAFIHKNKKQPSQISINVDEKRLGQWLSTQKQNYKNKTNAMKDELKYNLWTTFLEEYKDFMKSNDDIWNELFESLKIFIKENKKQPYSILTDSFEKKLGQWLSSQKNNYKKKINSMKDQDKYDQWTEFLKEYAQYMSPTKTDASETESIASASETASSTSTKPKTPRKKSMKLQTPQVPKETPEQKRQRHKTELSTLHQRYKTLTSQHLREEFTANPELWHKYHEIAEANEQSFPADEIPRNRIIQELNKIETNRTKRVVDMGCGKADIAKYFASDPRFQFTNYDHISSNDTVESCDIANIPLKDNSVEICILSLAMWGSNCKEYIREAYRILERNGELYIIEPTKRWSEKDESDNIVPEKEGVELQTLLEENGLKIIYQNVAKFCMYVCTKNPYLQC
jgi:superfamily II DNA or RNA helicase